MKKVAIALMIAAMIFVMCVMVAHGEEQHYGLIVVVNDLDYDTDTVYMVDLNGEEWMMDGCKGWHIGDVISLVMDTMGTESIYDDVIIVLPYQGWLPLK